MALHWNWTDKIGTATYEDGSFDNLYSGNAYIIALREWEEETDTTPDRFYNLAWFAADKDHMKNMLGLNRKSGFVENIFEKYGITDIELDGSYRNIADIVNLILKSKWQVNIKIYY